MYTTVEVDVYLGDFDTDDLLEELESRGVKTNHVEELAYDEKMQLEKIWQLRRTGRDYGTELELYLSTKLDRVV
jgi:hypothetical protein